MKKKDQLMKFYGSYSKCRNTSKYYLRQLIYFPYIFPNVWMNETRYFHSTEYCHRCDIKATWIDCFVSNNTKSNLDMVEWTPGTSVSHNNVVYLNVTATTHRCFQTTDSLMWKIRYIHICIFLSVSYELHVHPKVKFSSYIRTQAHFPICLNLDDHSLL